MTPEQEAYEERAAIAEYDGKLTRAEAEALAARLHPSGAPKLRSRKGGDPTQWPDDLRVREWPALRGKR